MKTTTTVLAFLSTTLLTAAAGCTDAPATASERQGLARIGAVVTGDSSTTLEVRAIDSASGTIAASQQIALAADGSAATTLALPEGHYQLDLSAIARRRPSS